MFPPFDEIRIRRFVSGYQTDLCKDGKRHSTLFDTFEGPPPAKKVIALLVSQIEETSPKVIENEE